MFRAQARNGRVEWYYRLHLKPSPGQTSRRRETWRALKRRKEELGKTIYSNFSWASNKRKKPLFYGPPALCGLTFAIDSNNHCCRRSLPILPPTPTFIQLYCTVLYCNVLYCNLLYCTVLYCNLLYDTVGYSTVRFGTIRYGTVRYSTVHYSTVRHGTARYGTAWYGTVRYGTVRYCYRLKRTAHSSGDFQWTVQACGCEQNVCSENFSISRLVFLIFFIHKILCLFSLPFIISIWPDHKPFLVNNFFLLNFHIVCEHSSVLSLASLVWSPMVVLVSTCANSLA